MALRGEYHLRIELEALAQLACVVLVDFELMPHFGIF
jgi:hypothetical protein